MLTITINKLQVGSISNIGSLNVGKTILCRNNAFNSESGGSPGTPDMAELPLPGFPVETQALTAQIGHPPIPPTPTITETPAAQGHDGVITP